MKLLWLTDLHLNQSSRKMLFAELNRLAEASPEAILVGGDTSDAGSLEADLRAIRKRMRRPVYFVLGNHDYDGGSIAQVRQKMRELSCRESRIWWLADIGYAHLDGETALVGHGCWGDGRGVPRRGTGMYRKAFGGIEELKNVPKEARLTELQRLGDEAAAYLGRFAREAAARYRKVLILTHTPLFPEATLYQGRCDPRELSYFCCQAAGQALLQVAREHPATRFTVLSGHTHHAAACQPLPNLIALVQGTEPGRPTWRLLDC